MKGEIKFASVLTLFTICATVCADCEADDAAVYNIKLQFFQENSFASTEFQWANIFGQSHNRSYALYRDGEEVAPLVQKFIKTGSLDGLLDYAADEPKVYDQFTTTAGDDAEVMVLVNGDNSLLSFICQMASSPHWFAGVDSLPLCVNSFWVDQLNLELDPMNLIAHEDTYGYADVVKKISLKNAEHQPRSRLEHHIAKAEITKVKEYSTIELNNLVRKELIAEEKAQELPRSRSSYYDDIDDDEGKDNNDLERLKGLEEEPIGTPKPGLPENNVIVISKAPNHKSITFGNKALDDGNDLKNMDEVVLAVASGRKLGLKKHLPRHFKSRLHHAVNRHSDCQVSDWSAWSDCTEPCGNGRTVRMRTIVQQREGEGRGCPHLIESKTCGQPCRGDLDYLS